MPSLSNVKDHASMLPPVTLAAATCYQQQLPEMTAFVDENMRKQTGIINMIGGNPLQMMYENHRHHGAFMATVFTVGNYQLLAQTLPWVYRVYHNRGFSYEYFPLELRCWITAVEEFIPAELQSAIIFIYQWMIGQHNTLIELSQQELDVLVAVDSDWLERKNEFRVAALRGDHRLCLKMATTRVKHPEDIIDFYLQVLQPALYEVGILWEKNKISVAQEHLASAIVTRVMAAVNLVLIGPESYRGRAVVAACANEYHEIGAMMIADILETDKWNVSYLGANVPAADLLDHLRIEKPDVLALSVTMPFNINQVAELIGQIRQDTDMASIKIIVGGRAFSGPRELWKQVGADACAADLVEARQLMRTFRSAA
ncbi:cobalamin B12-binding domain-containing protein [Pelovirga terrestris]|uniref:Cobalamin B12-binding domain-containing protein n=1 Tax=Pelovirga terrestris TaxID=2771352 RepID=A0A8J6UQ95_9BACT|nr:cobalamin-dependent protein [Pelovirga terrestris]MBD1401834.1 cobalamin B12-binding domain-containing protein [Pelovirga terrestris]